MITTLARGKGRVYEVKLLRNSVSAPRYGDIFRTVYSDHYVRLASVFNDSDRLVGYRFEFRGSRTDQNIPPVHETPFSVGVFYRNHDGKYIGREFIMVYSDKHVRILKFGDRKPDYAFLTLCPPQQFRAGDKRFSTIANVHPIEEETLDVDMVIGGLDGE